VAPNKFIKKNIFFKMVSSINRKRQSKRKVNVTTKPHHTTLTFVFYS